MSEGTFLMIMMIVFRFWKFWENAFGLI